jgi:hypothetical protein
MAAEATITLASLVVQERQELLAAALDLEERKRS